MAPSLKKLFKNGHERTINAKLNILFAFAFKGLSAVLNLLLVPLTLHYLNPTKYGVWITISSVVVMLSFFDIGLGNGLRNKFAEAKAKGLNDLCREYISTTYATLIGISALLFVIFNIIFPFIDWSLAFNTESDLREELGKVIYIMFSFYCFQFVFNLIGTIATADQKPFYNNLFNFLYTLLSFIAIYIITRFSDESLYLLSLSTGGIPTLVLLISSLILFNTKYKSFAPTIRHFKFDHIKEIASLGFSFFIIQLSTVVIFSTGNIIISLTMSPAEVTPYSIAYKYFGMVTMAYHIIIIPFWSSFTDAWHRSDLNWIKNIMKNLNRLSLAVLAILIIMVLVAPYIYHYWVGDQVIIPTGLNILIAIYVLLYTSVFPFNYFINGVSKIRLHLYLSLTAAIINIPLTLFLVTKLNLHLYGIILGPIICLIPYAILMPLQYSKIINNQATGIWDK